MSIVLLNADVRLGEVLVRRLVAEGDEIRVIEDDPVLAGRWKELGAHVARGQADDVDLVMRAAENARTLAVLDRDPSATPSVAAAAVEAARLSSVDRIVVSTGRADRDLLEGLVGSGMDHVVLNTQGAGLAARLRKKTIPLEALAAAIDAADDLAGNPRLVLDLQEADAWSALGLAATRP